MKIDELRKKHQKLIYRGFIIDHKNDDLTITSHFTLTPDIEFNPQVTIHGVSTDKTTNLTQEELYLYAFNLGMAEIFSYWKTAAPQEIIIEAGSLSSEQVDFWHNLLIQGMGEYFYVNQIDFTDPDFVKIDSTREENPLKTTSNPLKKNHLNGVLIPLGGGKDSLVSLELLKEHYQGKISLFALNPIEAVKEAVKLNSDLPFITATRVIDPKLLELNKKGYLNGHTPFSSYLAFLSVFVARLFSIEYIAISNERSSNEESVIYKNHPINHQYSKSYQLEESFQKYFDKLPLTSKPVYFSLLRPLYELQIAKLFSRKDTYSSIFRSCNKGQKNNSWCCNCSKCLFAFIILYPFLTKEKITSIFSINLLNNEDLWNTTKELLGYSNQKPLDCVGTHEESLAALYLCHQSESKHKESLSKITQMFEKEILPREKNLEARSQKILQSWNDHHSLPTEFDRILKYVHQNNF
jgi:UDP-N-acetyl-alpha-D-muramoyl-L-alanyl-L-glutamate epimerase